MNQPTRRNSVTIQKFSGKKVGIVCPMGNEIQSAVEFTKDCLKQFDCLPETEIRFFPSLDNVAKDGTKEALEELAKTDPRVSVVFSPQNRCVVDAYMRGYEAALDWGADWILEIDAGFSHDPRKIPEFLQAAENADIVYSTRFTKGGRIINSSFKRKCISKFGGLVSNLLLGTKLGDMTGGYILHSRKVLEHALQQGIQSKGPFFQTEMKFHSREFTHAEVPIHYSGASHNVGKKALDDAKQNLRRLAKSRFLPKSKNG